MPDSHGRKSTTKIMTKPLTAIAVCILAGTANLAYSQDTTPVSRAEYDKLKAEHQQLIKEVAELKTEMGEILHERTALQKLSSPVVAPVSSAQTSGKEDFVANPLATVVTTPGTSQLTITGGASATYISSGANNDFSAMFNPIILWKLSDYLRFDGDIAFYSNRGTQIQTAVISYDFNEYITLEAGRFANPTNYWAVNLRKDWVNKLPDNLGAFLLPEFEDGVQVQGAIPIGSTLLTYAAFVGKSDAFRNFPSYYNYPNYVTNVNSSVEVGGRIAFQPIPGLVFGYGVETFKSKGIFNYETDEYYYYTIGMDTYSGNYFLNHSYAFSVQPVLQTVDLNYRKELTSLRGALDFHAQWTWSNIVNSSSNPPAGYKPAIAPFDDDHNGGYVQLAYRPTLAPGFVANLEPVVRYVMNDSIGETDEQLTLGLDYWFTDRTVVKGAYGFQINNSYPGRDSFILQFATGF